MTTSSLRPLLLALALAFAGCLRLAADIRVAFLRPDGWNNIPHIHAYANDRPLPGCDNQEMRPVSGLTGWFVFTIPGTHDNYNIIFNNGGWAGGQTADFHATDSRDRAFRCSGNAVSETDGTQVWAALDAPAPEPPSEGDYIFHRPDSWAQTPRIVAYKEKELVRLPENRVIYEVFVRNFSPEGNFRGVEKQVQRLRDLGVDVIWLMPVQPGGREGMWGTYPSPYAIRDYKALDSGYGGADDFRRLVKAAHDAGMELWMDWVGNHTALDHHWVREHREYYKRNGSEIVHPFGWNDVYQLDYSNQALRAEMIDAMRYWVREFDIDGFRCDYADGVPRDFWAQARNALAELKPSLAWLAESGGDGGNARLVSDNGPFDYNYAWAFRDKLAEFASHGNVGTLRDLCRELFYDDAYTGKSRMVYLTNHDVVQDKGGTEDRLLGRRLEPLTVLEFTIYGMPLIYNGQEVRYSHGSVSLAEKTPVDWNSGDPRMTELITSLCRLKHSEPALRTGASRGELYTYSASSPDVFVYERRLGSESVVVMLNFGGSSVNFSVSDALPSEVYMDVFSGDSRSLAASGAFSLPAYGYAVYVK